MVPLTKFKYTCLFLTISKDFGINVKMKSLLAFILSLVFCGCSPSFTATPPLLSSFSLGQRSAWYSRDCLLFFPLQSTLLLFSYFPHFSFLYSLHLSSLASWCTLFVSHFCSPLPRIYILSSPVLISLRKYLNPPPISLDDLAFISGCYSVM